MWAGEIVTRTRAALAPTLPAPCPYCGLPVLPGQRWQVDHKRPRIHGGTDEAANLRVAHGSCNESAGSQLRRGTDHPPSRQW
jgi:5-methylcytosine-specific restriction endonuclease McrA